MSRIFMDFHGFSGYPVRPTIARLQVWATRMNRVLNLWVSRRTSNPGWLWVETCQESKAWWLEFPEVAFFLHPAVMICKTPRTFVLSNLMLLSSLMGPFRDGLQRCINHFAEVPAARGFLDPGEPCGDVSHLALSGSRRVSDFSINSNEFQYQ